MLKETGIGRLKVHDDVIMAIVEEAALATEGVAHMVSRGVRDDLNQWLKKDDHGRGVTILVEESTFSIDLYVAVFYRERLADLGRRLVDRIYEAVDKALGFGPARITIHVEGLEMRE